MSEILIPTLVYLVILICSIVLLTASFVTLASYFNWFNVDD